MVARAQNDQRTERLTRDEHTLHLESQTLVRLLSEGTCKSVAMNKIGSLNELNELREKSSPKSF
jgi:hypothetical protein